MKSFCLNLLVVTFLLAHDVAAQKSEDILLYSNGKNQTWEQYSYGTCSPIMKPDGARLVKVYNSVSLYCDDFADAQCKTAGSSPPRNVVAGLVNVPVDYKGYFICRPLQR